MDQEVSGRVCEYCGRGWLVGSDVELSSRGVKRFRILRVRSAIAKSSATVLMDPKSMPF